jgi:hypothetical protein
MAGLSAELLDQLRTGQREHVHAVQTVAALIEFVGHGAEGRDQGLLGYVGLEDREDRAGGAWPDGIVEVLDVTAAADHLRHLRVTGDTRCLEGLDDLVLEFLWIQDQVQRPGFLNASAA